MSCVHWLLVVEGEWLLNLDVAAREGAAGGVTIAQADG